ncbi:MAG: substrate-binding domain-containing protein, partial [Erysipelotrichaceae bacterium]
EKTLKAALESFQPMAGSYKFTMNQTGSGDGWKRVLGSEKDGASGADIGFASREFKAGEEDITNAVKSGTYCVDAVVTIVNETNKNMKDITAAQIKDIYTAKLTKWEDVK